MAAASPPAVQSRQTLTRDDVVRLASGDRPWVALPVLAQVLRVPGGSGDHGLRFLAAACFAKVGLRTPAGELFEGLPPEVRRDPQVAALGAAIEALQEDAIGFAERQRVCEGNVRALVERGVDLRDVLARWVEERSSSGEIWLRARDGNIVVQREAGSLEFRHLVDFVGQVAALKLPHEAGGTTNIKPYVLEGADPPWLLRRVMQVTPDQADGYRVRVSLVQRDELELLDGLSMADLREELRSPRLHVFVGEDATRRLERELLSRTDVIIAGHFLGMPARGKEWGGLGRCEPPPEHALQRAAVSQQAESVRLEAAVRVEYSARDAAWYGERFRTESSKFKVQSGEVNEDRHGVPAHQRPLRVLLPTCRYSTYIKHAAADLCEAFKGVGCEARTLIEPDDQSQMSSVAYLRAIAEFQPDLVVLINYTRSNIGAVIPAGVPVVTWVQDAMPHLFDAKTGEAMGKLDFVVGHTHVELYERFGYPAQNRMKLPVTASTTKFHDGPVDPALREKFACDVAFITHHSETPERMHARLCEEAARAGSGSAVVRIFEELRPRIRGLVEAESQAPIAQRVRDAAIATAVEVIGREPDARTGAMLVNQYAFPMADRMVRHRVLSWAADVCEARGWRMRVFGRGWEKHERLAAMAGPEIAHGEELRAAYAAAGVTVHASIHWMYHQRVMECALSGGLPAVFLKPDDVSLLRAWVVLQMADVGCGMSDERAGKRELERRVEKAGAPTGRSPTYAATSPLGEVGKESRESRGAVRDVVCAAADCAEAMGFVAQLQRIGRPVHPAWAGLTITPRMLETAKRAWSGMPDEPRAAMLLGDLAETTFATREGLEGLIERAIASPARRENLSRGIAARVREHYSTQKAAEGILELVARAIRKD